MTSKQHQLWINRGSPFRLARPLMSLRDHLRAAGYTVYDIGNNAHLDHQPPEDHTPYSETGWPQKIAPYGVGCACDVMPPPKDSGLPSLQVLGERLHDDKTAGRADFIKYMNWGPVDDSHAVQDRWQPGHERRSSTDIGHIHLSVRTDFVDSTAFDSYNPLAAVMAADLRERDMQMLVSGLDPDPDQVWLCDGMLRRKVDPSELETDPKNSKAGTPIGNQQIHQNGLLGNLGWDGKVFPSGGGNLWGVDVATLGGGTAATVDQAQVDAAVQRALGTARFETRAVLPE